MAKHIHNNYYEDNYQKVECQACKRSFIIGEKLSENMHLSCPYCLSKDIMKTASTTNEIIEKLDLGCLGLYFHIYDDGRLMLYTTKEFSEAINSYALYIKDQYIPVDLFNQIMMVYCSKRDNKQI